MGEKARSKIEVPSEEFKVVRLKSRSDLVHSCFLLFDIFIVTFLLSYIITEIIVGPE